MIDISKCINKSGQFQPRLVSDEIKAFLFSETPFLATDATLKQRFYCVRDGVKELPLCICGAAASWDPYRNKFLTYCSSECSNSAMRGEKGRKRAAKRTNFREITASSVEELISILRREDGNFNGNLTNERHINEKTLDMLRAATKFMPDDSPIVSRLLACSHDLTANDFTCLECGGWVEKKRTQDIKKMFCSVQCSNTNEKKQMATKDTCIERFGTSSNLVTNHKIVNQAFLAEEHIRLFQEGMTVQQIADKLGASFSRVNTLLSAWADQNDVTIKKRNVSTVQEAVRKIFEEHGIEVTSNRTLIKPYEIDFYSDKLRMGVEIHGIYWHSERFKTPDYHLKKLLLAEKANIKLMQFFEHEINEKTDVVRSMITSSQSKRIFARKCEVVVLTSQEYRSFLKDNHIQGPISSSIRYGLKFEGEIVCVMGVGKPRFTKSYPLELHRFCNLLNHVVVGGFSKLISVVRKNHAGEIISYADRRFTHTQNNVYEKNGFKLLKTSRPGYIYVHNNMSVVSRYQAQKHKLKNLLQNFDPSLSESENMSRNNYHKIWDAGQLVYVLN